MFWNRFAFLHIWEKPFFFPLSVPFDKLLHFIRQHKAPCDEQIQARSDSEFRDWLRQVMAEHRGVGGGSDWLQSRKHSK